MTAEWRSIPGYEGRYEASSLGEIRSVDRITSRGDVLQPLKGRVLKFTINKRNGYKHVALCRDGVQRSYTIHSLVALAFIGPCPDGQEVRHDDGVRTNNRAGNLLYGTRKENSSDRERHGTAHKGEKIAGSRLKESDVLAVRNLIAEGKSLGFMAREFGVTASAIQGIRDGRTWSYLGPITRGPDQADEPVPALTLDPADTALAADQSRWPARDAA